MKNITNKIMFTSLTASLIVLFSGIGTLSVEGLESDESYFLDSENTFMILEMSQNGTPIILEGGISVDEVWYDWDAENLKVTRITDNGDAGRIFGTTDEGISFYIIYDLNESEIRIKVWHDRTTTSIIEDISATSLF